MNEKLCVFCKHFEYEQFGYSCGDTWDDKYGGFTCNSGHYKEKIPYSNDDFRGLILKAEKCGDYERPHETPEPLGGGG